jgi:hypothetical protein
MRQPLPDSRDDRPQPLAGAAQAHQQPTDRDHIEGPGTRRRLFGPQRGHILDITLEKFCTKKARQRIEALRIRALLGHEKT